MIHLMAHRDTPCVLKNISEKLKQIVTEMSFVYSASQKKTIKLKKKTS